MHYLSFVAGFCFEEQFELSNVITQKFITGLLFMALGKLPKMSGFISTVPRFRPLNSDAEGKIHSLKPCTIAYLRTLIV